MRSFNLFLNVSGDWISISRSDENDIKSEFPCYDENLSEGEHSQYSLSFSIVTESLYGEEGVQVSKSNPLLPFIHLGAKLHLILDKKDRIDFIIKSISPQTSSYGSIYNIEAQDEVSFLWSKHNLGYNYSTVDADGNLIIKDIFTIAKEVLQDNYIYDWNVASFSLDASLLLEKMTLELENSNPYNVLIEACNTVGAKLIVNYYTKHLDFIRQNRLDFSGYRYSPKNNLISYEADHSIEEMTTILHVSGGEDANGQIISMVPPMPEPVRKWFFYNIGSEEQWDDVLNENFNWDNVKNTIPDDDEISIQSEYVFITVRKNVDLITYKKDVKEFSVIFDENNNPNLYFSIDYGANSGNYQFPLIEQDGKYILDPRLAWSTTWEGSRDYKIIYRLYDFVFMIMPSVEITLQDHNVESIIFNPIGEAEYNKISYYSNPTNAFIPVVAYSLNNINQDIIYNSNFVYFVKYDEIKYLYYGYIKSDAVEYKFEIKHKEEQPFGEPLTNYIDRGKEFLRYKVNAINTLTKEEQELYIYQFKNEVDDYIKTFKDKQRQECNSFFAIANKIPYLGQSIIDFTPFRANLSVQEWNDLEYLINVKLRNYNIQLQYCSSEFYTKLSELTVLRENFKTLGDIYGAACKSYQDFLQIPDIELEPGFIEECDAYEDAITTADNNLLESITNSNYFILCQHLGLSKELEIEQDYIAYFNNRKQEQLKIIETYSEQMGISLDGVHNNYNSGVETTLQYYASLRAKAEEYCYDYDLGGFSICQGIYDKIIDNIQKASQTIAVFPSNNGLATKYEALERGLRDNVMQILYANYGQYIYESTYQNTDEIDCISLFNQAIIYFADLNRPQSSYSLEVLDIGSLELVGIPRLYVNSLIQVYNRNNIYVQPYKDILYNIDKYEAMALLKHTDEYNSTIHEWRQRLFTRYFKNEPKSAFDIKNSILVRNGQTEDKPTDYKITTENIEMLLDMSEDTERLLYLAILDKLYYDTINVVGINRVLREPLKDSVTVEQSSRYKTILSKLIKSI